MFTHTGTDLDTRLAELIERFETRAAEQMAGRGRTIIRYNPPRMAWGPPNDWHRDPRRWWWPNDTTVPPITPTVCELRPQSWTIVYLHDDGSLFYVGHTIGTTKAAATRWLLDYFKQWP